jgi:5-methyltetrahydrofolate--homocysteine methyltransferase
MTQSFPIQFIGERINPGFKSTKALFDNSDIRGIQVLAVKQAEAGAAYLNVNTGSRALTDPGFMVEVIRAIQDVVDLPLSFDFPSAEVQRLCFQAYDPAKARGRKAILNSITEHRWGLSDLAREFPLRVILMTSERVEDGAAKGNRTAEQIYGTCCRGVERLCSEYNLTPDDILLDMSVSAIIADTDGLNDNTLQAMTLVYRNPALKGVHMMGGLSNIGQQLPPRALDGSDLKHSLECAFLTVAVPRGLDTVLGTPWREYHPLAEDNYVLQAYRTFLASRGSNALRAVRKFYRA